VWERWPEAGVAIRTDGLLVIDLDPGCAWLSDDAKLDALRKCASAIAKTPRGGTHYWFAGGDFKSTNNQILAGLDTRAEAATR